MEYFTLWNGIRMPALGFGTWTLRGDAGRACVRAALETGYRLLDTAQMYENEEMVGEAVRDSGIPREEMFLTTKLSGASAGYREAKEGIRRSLRALGTDYIDLLLIHEPYEQAPAMYRAMEEACRAGKVRAIGVCNFNAARLLDFCETVDIIPAVDQIEIHPFFQQKEALKVMREYGVIPEAWGPFAEGKFGIFTHPVLTAIGQKYGKTAAQTALRWNIQRGVVVIPKSVHKERIEQNFDVWDFALTDEEMAEIEALDLGRSEIVDHNDPAFIRMLHNLNVHE